jgi:hypothetical protein
LKPYSTCRLCICAHRNPTFEPVENWNEFFSPRPYCSSPPNESAFLFCFLLCGGIGKKIKQKNNLFRKLKKKFLFSVFPPKKNVFDFFRRTKLKFGRKLIYLRRVEWTGWRRCDILMCQSPATATQPNLSI